jgi:hypothetical protein
MTEVAIAEALGESLSPSQATTYLTCPAKWYFRYLVGLSEPTTGALAAFPISWFEKLVDRCPVSGPNHNLRAFPFSEFQTANILRSRQRLPRQTV